MARLCVPEAAAGLQDPASVSVHISARDCHWRSALCRAHFEVGRLCYLISVALHSTEIQLDITECHLNCQRSYVTELIAFGCFIIDFFFFYQGRLSTLKAYYFSIVFMCTALDELWNNSGL